jgi:ATPase complex subunit ATP10
MRHHKGKSFLAPPAIFKADVSLYFPNFFGRTLRKDVAYQDTTSALTGKISVVSLFTSTWAETQAATFTSETANPKLHEVIKNSNGAVQMVSVNVEDEPLKYWIIKLFMWNIRKKYEAANWGKYFLIKKSLSDEQRDAMGHLNAKVGYIYLVDGNCKIRWAGSGESEGDEKDSLTKGVRRLVEDLKTKKVPKASALAPTHGEEEPETAAEKVAQVAA